MPNSNDPINIDKPQIEVLMDQINVANAINLDANDFIFSTPIPASVSLTEINTRIKITPKITSGYYSERDIYYKRIDISQLFNNDFIEIIVTTETLLSELIPQINLKYGIKLTVDDYLDTPLPTPDPLVVNPTVSVVINPESYIYVGVGGLVLGERVRPVDDSNYIRDIMVITDTDNGATFINEANLLNTNYQLAGYFELFRNTTSVDMFRVDKLLSLPNGNFYMGGSFEFEAALGAVPLQAYNSTGVIVNSNGLIEVASNTTLFGTGLNKRYGVNKNINFVYLADPDNLVTPANSARLYRYNLDGSIDNTFTPTGISYAPEVVRVADDGKLYTSSPEYIAPLASDPGINAKHIRIDRLNSDGTIDSTFSPIIITSSGTADVTPVVDILPLTGGGGFVCLKPIHGLSVTGTTPLINGTSFVTGTEPTDSAFNPVFRFGQSGSLVSTFKNTLLNNHPDTILIDTPQLKVNDNVLSYADNKVILLANRINPLTGFVHKSPLSFNTAGNVLNIAPDRLASDIRWSTVTSFIRLDNGKFIIVGNGLRRLATGGWSTTEAILAIYNQSGQLTNIGYKPVVAGVVAPQIYHCALAERFV